MKKSALHIMLKPACRIWVQFECNCPVVGTFFSMAFLGIGVKIDLFQSCGHCWVFQICWYIVCRTFMASTFRILNTSAGITSPPLALLTVVLSRDHLNSHSRMSGSGWVTTPSWLSGSLRSFFIYSSSECSFYLFFFNLFCFLGLYCFCPLFYPTSWITALSWQSGLHNSVKLWAMSCRATQDEWVIVESSDKTWSTGRGNDKQPQYTCCENPMSYIKRQKDILVYNPSFFSIPPFFHPFNSGQVYNRL